MNFKKLVVAVLAVAVLAAGAVTAEAKSRVSSKPSSYSSRSVTKAATVQRSSYSAPKAVTSTTNVRNVAPSRPTVYRSAPQKTTVIQKNYYGGNSGYNRNSGSYGGGSYGGSGGSGVGTAIVGGAAGAVGGMLLMDALTEDEGEKALKLQQEQIKIEEARAQQEHDDKQDQILENQKEEEVREEKLREEVAADPFFKLNPELIPAK